MKKLNLLKSMMLLCMLMCGMGAWADTATSSTMTASTTYQDLESGKLIEYKNSAANTYSSPLRIYANNTFTFHAKSGVEKITKIEITANSNTYATDTKNATWSASGTGTCSVAKTVSNSAVTATITGTATTVTCKPSSQVRWDAVTVTYVTSGGSVQQYSYTLETVGSGTTTFKDASGNTVAANQKVNSGTTITPTFTPADGYEFTSWEYYTSTGTWSNVKGTDFTITKDVQFRVTYSVVVPKAKYPVTILTPENGTLTIKDGETIVNSGDEVEEGKLLTVEVNAATGYKFKNWGYKDGDANWVGNNTSSFNHVMPSAPCSFKATFEEIPSYTVAWNVNGTEVKSETVYEGTTVTAPVVADINGKKFRGWSETFSVNPETGDLVVPSATAERDAVYYAVFASLDSEGDVVTVDEGTTIASWSKRAFDENTPTDADTGTGKITSSKKLSGGTAIYTTMNSGISGGINIVISDLNLTSYEGKNIMLTFVARASQGGTLSVSTSTNGTDFTDFVTTSDVAAKDETTFTIENIPANTKSIKIIPEATSGSFYFGSVKLTAIKDDNYTFSKLTEDNTNGWTESDWDGYYVIANGTQALNGNHPAEKNFYTIATENDQVELKNASGVFKVEYVEGEGYAVKGLCGDFYLAPNGTNSVKGETSVTYMNSISYNSLKYESGATKLQLSYNSSKFGFYSSNFTAPTFYKILSTPASYSEYTTTPADPITISIRTDEGYGTFVCADAVVVPENVRAAVAEAKGDKLVWNWMYKAGDIIPAYIPVLVNAEKDDYSANITVGGEAPTTNYLYANTTGEDAQANTIAPSAAKFYALTYNNNGEDLGFYWRAEGGASFSVADGKVFLGLPAGVHAKSAFVFGDETDGIENVSVDMNDNRAYNLAGQRVNANAKGIVIVNGRKYINK